MNGRIAGYDFARSLAVFGLVSVNFFNISVTKIHFYGLHFLIRVGSITTFLMLGGIGVSLLIQQFRITNDTHASADSRKKLIRRAASLLVIGICCNLIWRTYFLSFYSICIVIGALLLTLSNRWLWVLAFIFGLIWAGLIFLIYDYYDIIRNWETLQNSDPWTVEGMLFRLYGFQSIYWLTFLLIGMWLGRQDIRYLRVRKDMFFGGITVALVSTCTLWLLGHISWSIDLDLVDTLLLAKAIQRLGSLLYIFVICGTATAIIGGSLMLTEKYPDAKWMKLFVATGQLALTLYVTHLVIWTVLQTVLGNFEKSRPLFAIGSAVLFCICALMFSHFWRKRFERGPLEWGIRRITG